MQTFLPFPDFRRSLRTLDYRRLGKQRVEGMQLLQGSWSNHPASKMWRGYEFQLAEYTLLACIEWVKLGYNDSCFNKVMAIQDTLEDTSLPPWFGNAAFHRSHQSNLVRKMPERYASLFSGVPDDLPYVWPV